MGYTVTRCPIAEKFFEYQQQRLPTYVYWLVWAMYPPVRYNAPTCISSDILLLDIGYHWLLMSFVQPPSFLFKRTNNVALTLCLTVARPSKPYRSWVFFDQQVRLSPGRFWRFVSEPSSTTARHRVFFLSHILRTRDSFHPGGTKRQALFLSRV